MQLMIQRGQKQGIIFRPVFELWAKFELTPEEGALIQKYGARKFILKQGNPGEFMRAVKIALVLTFFVIAALDTKFGIFTAIKLGIPFAIIATLIIYHSTREQIIV